MKGEPFEKNCEECGVRMVFLRNPNTGKNVPVDYSSYHGEETYNRDVHTSHFDTCTEPGRFSRGSAKASGEIIKELATEIKVLKQRVDKIWTTLMSPERR